jgi:hypothetical protein
VPATPRRPVARSRAGMPARRTVSAHPVPARGGQTPVPASRRSPRDSDLRRVRPGASCPRRTGSARPPRGSR